MYVTTAAAPETVTAGSVLLDTGSSIHVTNVPAPPHLRMPPLTTTIHTGAGSTSSQYSAIYRFKFGHNTGRTFDLRCDYCPTFTITILSVRTFLDACAAKLTLTSRGGIIRLPDHFTIKLELCDDVYVGAATISLPGPEAAYYTRAIGNAKRTPPARGMRLSLTQAHRLFGHCRDMKALKSMCKHTNIELTSNTMNECIACTANHNRGHNRSGTSSREHGRWSFDFKVNVCDEDTNDNTLFASAYSYHSHFVWAEALPARDVATITEPWKRFKAENIVMRVRLDNSKEMKSLANMPENRDIEWEWTIPHSPFQNGAAEKYNDVLMTRVLVLLLHHNLNRRLWDLCLAHVVHLHNRTPLRSIGYNTPMQMEFPVAHKDTVCPKLDFLAEFGAPVLVLINKANRGKEDTTKSELAIYCGIDKNGYICVSARGIYVSRDVKLVRETWAQIASQHPQMYRPLTDYFEAGSHTLPEIPKRNPEIPKRKPLLKGSVFDESESDSDCEVVAETKPTRAGEVVDCHYDSGDDNDGADKAPGSVTTVPLDSDAAEAPHVSDEDSSTNNGPSWSVYDKCSFSTKGAVANDRPLPGSGARALKVGESVTYKQSQTMADHAESHKAAQKEMADLHALNALELARREEADGHKILILRMLIKRKADKYKGRAPLDGRGHLVDEVIKTMDSYAPTARPHLIHTLLCIACTMGYIVRAADIGNAYVQTGLDEDLYIYVDVDPSLPQEFRPPPGHVYRARRAIYGLSISGNLWHKHLKNILEEIGFRASTLDGALFTRTHDNGSKIEYVLVYVDDLLIVCKTRSDYDDIIAHLKTHLPKITENEPDCFTYLSYTIKKGVRGYTLCQRALAASIVSDLGLSDSTRYASTPLAKTHANGAFDDGKPLDKMAHTLYRRVVGKLSYLTGTRHDLLFARKHLSRFLVAPTHVHMNMAKHVGRYINGTMGYGLSIVPCDLHKLTCYCDSDHGSDVDSRTSTTGYFICLGTNVVAAGSNAQKTVAHSTCTAEAKAAAHAARLVVAQQHLMNELHIGVASPTPIFIDNDACVRINNNDKTLRPHLKHEHIDISQIRSFRDEGRIVLLNIDTDHNTADLNTKILSEATHWNHAQHVVADTDAFHNA